MTLVISQDGINNDEINIRDQDGKVEGSVHCAGVGMILMIDYILYINNDNSTWSWLLCG